MNPLRVWSRKEINMALVTGIIAEYNPFHNGHAYQIQKARELTGCDFVVVVMSGDFVQRGAPALFDKYTRTKMALLGGADLVLELPVWASSASAEFFAAGAVSVLEGIGCTDFLCFGAEDEKLSKMQKAVKLLADENTEFQKQLRDALKTGLSFPAARKQVLSGFLTEEESSILDKPNNILGIEYLKALKAKNSSIEPVIVKREGQGYHGQELSHGFASASGIRSALKDVGDWEQDEKISQLFHVMPKKITEIFIEAGKQNQMVWEDDFSLLLQYNLLKQKNRLQLTAYSDVSKDLAMRISKNLNQFESYSSFVQKLKTKELTYTRISRALLHILLEITQEETRMFLHNPYTRILGFRQDSKEVLGKMKKAKEIPVLTKISNYQKELANIQKGLFEKDIFASDLYEAVTGRKQKRRLTNELQHSPIILR